MYDSRKSIADIFPRQSTRPHIRHIQIHFTFVDPEKFELLARVADGTLGFGRMILVDINICGGFCLISRTSPDDPSLLETLLQNLSTLDTVEFDTQHLIVQYWHAHIKEEQKYVLDPMEMLVMNKIAMKRKPPYRVESMVRYHVLNEDETVDTWPTGIALNPDRVTRKTLIA